MYKKERVFIATRHKKEQVIAPIFQQVFDARPFVSSFINTDQFGTFTREIIRKDDPITTLRRKCEYGYKTSGCPLVVASEGSFGSHPSMPFVNANEEVVMFKDFNENIEVIGKYLSTDTNLYESEVSSIIELEKALSEIKFPDHGILIRDKEENEVILKGVFDHEQVIRFVSASLKTGQKLEVSSDMRAVYNPTRMLNIEKATQALVQNMQSKCPQCEAPGFIVSDQKPGLPCSNCGMPTRSIKTAIKKCQKCEYESSIDFPNKKEKEDPMYCDFCNP
tara:strand:- start:87722 stop:88555 length:834 start_codon:yes stop_codon:yes gene_type:complete